jgi:FkbM family methyltransferase
VILKEAEVLRLEVLKHYGLQNQHTSPLYLLKRIRKIAGTILRSRFKVLVGYYRYLKYRTEVHNFHDYSILQLLIYECGLPLDHATLSRLLNRIPTIVQFDDGTRYAIIDLEDFYHASMCYEPQTLAFILRQLKDGGVFVDVGANIGGYAIRAAKHAYVYAFEPEPRNFYLFKLNIRLNNVQSEVKAFQVAAGSYLGKAKLTISDYHGRHSLLNKDVRDRRTIEVDVVSLDNILASEDRIDVIKIDVEGAEPLVLKGAREILKRTKIVIIEATIPSSFHRASYILSEYSFEPAKKLDHNIVFVKK